MRSAAYNDPKHPVPLRDRIACIIPLYIPQGRTKDYGHFIEDKFETLKMNLACHQHYQSGLPYDIILVNNSSPQDADYFADQYRTLDRKNSGYGFGAWKYAWEQLKDDYDFFLFTEDDIAPTDNGWLARIFRRFDQDPLTGALGNYVEAHGVDPISSQVLRLLGSTRDVVYCLDGGWTFTSTKILRQVDKIGGLPVFPCQPESELDATVNELAFQQPILELGYWLDSFDGDHYIIHGSEVFTGDLSSAEGPMAPLINLNARHKIARVREHFAWYENK